MLACCGSFMRAVAHSSCSWVVLLLPLQPWEGDITLVLPSHLWIVGKAIVNPTTNEILNATRQVRPTDPSCLVFHCQPWCNVVHYNAAGSLHPSVILHYASWSPCCNMPISLSVAKHLQHCIEHCGIGLGAAVAARHSHEVFEQPPRAALLKQQELAVCWCLAKAS